MSDMGWISCYTPDGFRMSIPVGNTAAEITAVLDTVRSLGLLPREPGIEPGQESETIETVMRRESGDGTPVIDFYTAWSHNGKFGEHKYAHMYLNTAEDIAQFEAQSGLKLDAIPLYDGQAALKRVYGKPHAKETKVARAFKVSRIPNGEHDAGMPRYRYVYSNPIVVADAPNTDPETGETLPAWVKVVNIEDACRFLESKGMGKADIVRLIDGNHIHDLSAWAQWESGKAACGAILSAWETEQKNTPPPKPKNGKPVTEAVRDAATDLDDYFPRDTDETPPPPDADKVAF